METVQLPSNSAQCDKQCETAASARCSHMAKSGENNSRCSRFRRGLRRRFGTVFAQSFDGIALEAVRSSAHTKKPAQNGPKHHREHPEAKAASGREGGGGRGCAPGRTRRVDAPPRRQTEQTIETSENGPENETTAAGALPASALDSSLIAVNQR